MDTSAIDSLLEKTLSAWDIPGAAVAVIYKDETYTKGYGIRAAGENLAVNADTVFAIGSTSKAFTSAAVGVLVDSGQLTWDERVVSRLPDFAVYDPWITQQVTLRDLLCHRLCLERAQRLYYHGYSQAEIVRRMRFLRPTAGFRTQFQYANQNYTAAGGILQATCGQSWDDFLNERVFGCLGMSRSYSGYDRLPDFDNFAQPHAVVDETFPSSVRFFGPPSVVPNLQLSGEPSGSIHTTASDLLKWLACLLEDGAPLLGKATFAELTTPQVVMQDMPESELAPLYLLQPGTHFWTYGLGWWVMDYQGEKAVMHGGQMPGYNSMVAFYPERKLGLAVMVNVNQTLAHAALFYALSDLLLEKPGRDWVSEFKLVAQGYMAEVKGQADRARQERNTDLAPALPQLSYAGQYENEIFGMVEISEAGGELALRYGKVNARLEHWGEDRFLAHWNLAGLMENTLVALSPDAASLTLVNDRATYQRIG